MTAVVTNAPWASAASVLALKYEQMMRGSNQLDFHATHNSRGTRKRVFERIRELDEIISKTFAMDKSLLNPADRRTQYLANRCAVAITNWVLNDLNLLFDHVTIVFDAAFSETQTSQLRHAVKRAIGARKMRYRVHFHRVANEPNGQIADYIAWAHARFIARKDDEGLTYLNPKTHPLTWLK